MSGELSRLTATPDNKGNQCKTAALPHDKTGKMVVMKYNIDEEQASPNVPGK